MQTLFISQPYQTKYDDDKEVWDLFKGNLRIGIIYEDSREIRFTDTTTSHHISEIAELRNLVQRVNDQYIKLNA